MRHKRQTLYLRGYLRPYIIEMRSRVRVAAGEAVNTHIARHVEVGRWANETVNLIRHNIVAHNNYAHRANGRGTVVGGFKIYGRKIFHNKVNGKWIIYCIFGA